jgi:hypothetical protein
MKYISLKKIAQSIIFIQSIIVDKYNIFCKNKPKISKLIIDKHGTKYWYLNGCFHREDGPAIEWTDGGREWWLNGNLHREDGPAVEFANGYKCWYLYGTSLTKEDWFEKISEKSREKVLFDYNFILR